MDGLNGNQQSTDETQQFDFLDAITITSFMMQLQMYGKNITIRDMQTNLRDAVQEIENKIDDLDKHLERIERRLGSNENNQKDRKDDT